MKLGEKTKITIVNVGGNALAKEVAQVLRESGYKNVTVLPMQGEYAAGMGWQPPSRSIPSSSRRVTPARSSRAEYRATPASGWGIL